MKIVAARLSEFFFGGRIKLASKCEQGTSRNNYTRRRKLRKRELFEREATGEGGAWKVTGRGGGVSFNVSER